MSPKVIPSLHADRWSWIRKGQLGVAKVKGGLIDNNKFLTCAKHDPLESVKQPVKFL